MDEQCLKLLDFPEHLVLQVVKQLERKTRKRLRLVCKRFCAVVNSTFTKIALNGTFRAVSEECCWYQYSGLRSVSLSPEANPVDVLVFVRQAQHIVAQQLTELAVEVRGDNPNPVFIDLIRAAGKNCNIAMQRTANKDASDHSHFPTSSMEAQCLPQLVRLTHHNCHQNADRIPHILMAATRLHELTLMELSSAQVLRDVPMACRQLSMLTKLSMSSTGTVELMLAHATEKIHELQLHLLTQLRELRLHLCSDNSFCPKDILASIMQINNLQSLHLLLPIKTSDALSPLYTANHLTHLHLQHTAGVRLAASPLLTKLASLTLEKLGCKADDIDFYWGQDGAIDYDEWPALTCLHMNPGPNCLSSLGRLTALRDVCIDVNGSLAYPISERVTWNRIKLEELATLVKLPHLEHIAVGTLVLRPPEVQLAPFPHLQSFRCLILGVGDSNLLQLFAAIAAAHKITLHMHWSVDWSGSCTPQLPSPPELRKAFQCLTAVRNLDLTAALPSEHLGAVLQGISTHPHLRSLVLNLMPGYEESLTPTHIRLLAGFPALEKLALVHPDYRVDRMGPHDEVRRFTALAASAAIELMDVSVAVFSKPAYVKDASYWG